MTPSGESAPQRPRVLIIDDERFNLNALNGLLKDECKIMVATHGEQGLKAAATGRPDLILLDEPMAGVNPALKQSLLEHIRGLRDDGMTVLFVEHDMDMVMEVTDYLTVINFGKKIAEGTPEEIQKNPAVIEAYLGSEDDDDE